MADQSTGLVLLPELGPGQDMVNQVVGGDDEAGENAADLGQGRPDQPQRSQPALSWGRWSFPWSAGDMVDVACSLGTGSSSRAAADGQEGQGEHDGGDVPVPADPRADLVVGQTEQVLTGLVVLLDLPAQPGHRDELRHRRADAGVGQEELDVRRITEGFPT